MRALGRGSAVNCLGLRFPGSRMRALWRMPSCSLETGYFPATLDAGDVGME